MTQQNLKIIKLLRDHGLRPTNQRVLLAEVLFSSEGKILNRHVTAESLYGEVKEIGLKISLATIYNTLNQFTQSGLLREVTVNSGASYFDTNTSHHYHIFFEDTGKLIDIKASNIKVDGIPNPPSGTDISSIDLIIRVKSSS